MKGKDNMNLQGFNARRNIENPTEKLLHDSFISEFVESKLSYNAVDKIVYGTDEYGNPRDYLSDHEKQIVISTIQWLGSHVGECFLDRCGYKMDKNRCLTNGESDT